MGGFGTLAQRFRDPADTFQVVLVRHVADRLCLAMLHGFDFGAWAAGTPAERWALLPAAQEHILAQEDVKDRFVAAVRDLSRAFALAVPSDEATRIRDDVSFLQAVQSVLVKRAATETRPQEEIDDAVRRIISRAVAPEGVIDIFAAAGLAKHDISILSDEFLAEVRGMEHRNVAVELHWRPTTAPCRCLGTRRCA